MKIKLLSRFGIFLLLGLFVGIVSCSHDNPPMDPPEHPILQAPDKPVKKTKTGKLAHKMRWRCSATYGQGTIRGPLSDTSRAATYAVLSSCSIISGGQKCVIKSCKRASR